MFHFLGVSENLIAAVLGWTEALIFFITKNSADTMQQMQKQVFFIYIFFGKDILDMLQMR